MTFNDTSILNADKKIMVDILDRKIKTWYDQVKEDYGVVGEGFATIYDVEEEVYENSFWRYSIVSIYSKEENKHYRNEFLFMRDEHKCETPFQHWSSLLNEDLTQITEAEYYANKNGNNDVGVISI